MEQTFYEPDKSEKKAICVRDNVPLTSTEIAALWNTYMQYTMFTCVFEHFNQTVEDNDIRPIMEETLDIVQKRVSRVMELLNKEKLPIPIGFKGEDVNLKAPRLYSDPFYLYYLRDMNKFAIAISGLSLTTTACADVRDFYTHCVDSTMKLYNDATNTLLSKGLFIRPPYVTIAKEVDFVRKQDFLTGFLGKRRPLLAQEVSALAHGVMTSTTVKRLLLGFWQVVRSDQVKRYLERGINLYDKAIDTCSSKLRQENVPDPVTWDTIVTDSTIPPFSDKLIMFQTSYANSAFLISYVTWLNTSPRHDLSATYAKTFTEVADYAQDGMNIMIDNGWYEEPTRTVDRRELVNKEKH